MHVHAHAYTCTKGLHSITHTQTHMKTCKECFHPSSYMVVWVWRAWNTHTCKKKQSNDNVHLNTHTHM